MVALNPLVSTQKKPNKKSYFWTITSAFILRATRDNWVQELRVKKILS